MHPNERTAGKTAGWRSTARRSRTRWSRRSYSAWSAAPSPTRDTARPDSSRGLLFLDDVGTLPLAVQGQAHGARATESEAPGSSRPEPVDAWILRHQRPFGGDHAEAI